MTTANPPGVAWALGQINPCKVVHRPNCRYALYPYPWAAELSADELADKLVTSGGKVWHRGCPTCARDLIDAINRRTP